MTLSEQISAYVPQNEQEASDRRLMLRCLGSFDDLLYRENVLAHFTASGWVVSPDRSKTLMAYHNLYRSWSWLGGHADGEEDLLRVATREVREESGLEAVRTVSEDIFSLEVLGVSAHHKHGKFVSTHLHLNLTYLLEADPDAPLRIKPDENSGVRWFPSAEAAMASSEPGMQKIYQKLTERVFR